MNSFKRILTYFAIAPSNLQEILNELKKVIQITNPDYDIAITRLHLYYDMKLVTLGVK